MMKPFVLAAAVAGILALAPMPQAKADVDVRLYLGVPHYGYQAGPDYVYRRGYGWYRPANRVDRRRPGNRISCRQASRIVQRNGYRNVSARECGGRTYTFAGTRNGRRFVIYVNSSSGAMWRG